MSDRTPLIIAVPSCESRESLLKQRDIVLSEFREGEDLMGYISRRDEVVRESVETIESIVAASDAFDILEQMRTLEVMFTAEGQTEGVSHGSARELVALVLKGRGQRAPLVSHDEGPVEPEPIRELLAACGRLQRIGLFTSLAKAQEEDQHPLAGLSAVYVGHTQTVKSKQYAHLHDLFNAELFDSDETRSITREALGFTYKDFTAVRDEISTTYAKRRYQDTYAPMGHVRALRSKLGRQASRVINPILFEVMKTTFHEVGSRVSFTASDIASRTGIGLDRVAAILDRFSVSLSRTDTPLNLVEKYLSGNHPFDSATLLVDEQMNYLTLTLPIGTDSFRQIAEVAIRTETKRWGEFDKLRCSISEAQSIRYLEAIFGTTVSHPGLQYYKPRDPSDLDSVSCNASGVTKVADRTEADALFVVDNVAICVEVKAKSFSPRSKQGEAQMLANDLKGTIGAAADQAHRLERLIEQNGGLWLKDRTWLDLSHVEEVRSIAVFLDDIGPLGIAADELVRTGFLKHEKLPWLVSIHDLAAISKVLERPSEGLLYLRQRTDPRVSLSFRAIDELDMFMFFLRAGFARATTEAGDDRSSGVVTRIQPHTDALDAWMYFTEENSRLPAPKPRLEGARAIFDLVDHMVATRKPGWLRSTTDLLALQRSDQDGVQKLIHELQGQAAAENRVASAAYFRADSEGAIAISVASKLRGASTESAIASLKLAVTDEMSRTNATSGISILFSHASKLIAVQMHSLSPQLQTSDLSNAA